jgi:hypothetical protein
MRQKCIASLVVIFVMTGCSSSVKEPASTTIDPAIAKLQKQVEELQNATTLPPATSLPKEPPTVVRRARGYTGNSTWDEHECRLHTYYSDGSVTREDYWVPTTKTSGMKYVC